MRQNLQDEVHFDYPPKDAVPHRRQAICVRHMRQGIPIVKHTLPSQNHSHVRKAPQVPHLRQSLQPVIHAQDPHSHTQRNERVPVRHLR